RGRLPRDREDHGKERHQLSSDGRGALQHDQPRGASSLLADQSDRAAEPQGVAGQSGEEGPGRSLQGHPGVAESQSMTTLVTVRGAAAGTGNRYATVLSFLAKGTGTYALNDANFSGLGAFLPGLIAVATGTPANVTLNISDGSANKQIYGAGGGIIW